MSVTRVTSPLMVIGDNRCSIAIALTIPVLSPGYVNQLRMVEQTHPSAWRAGKIKRKVSG